MTKIEWADETVNVLGGCDNVSPGCDNCYARSMSHRLANNVPLYRGVTVNNGEGVEWTGRVNTDLEPLRRLRKKRDPQRVFVASMSDWCYPGVSTSFIGDLWCEMADQDRHTFMLLTKRPGRIRHVLGPSGCGFYASDHGPVPRPQPNIWLGTTVESVDYVWRIDQLRESPAAVRFLSLEPLLGPLPNLNLSGIDWVIVGGESGQKARPMHPDWVREIRHQCLQHDVAFFFKQWGNYSPHAYGGERVTLAYDGTINDEVQWPKDGECVVYRTRNKNAHNRLLDGQEWSQFPVTVLERV